MARVGARLRLARERHPNRARKKHCCLLPIVLALALKCPSEWPDPPSSPSLPATIAPLIPAALALVARPERCWLPLAFTTPVNSLPYPSPCPSPRFPQPSAQRRRRQVQVTRVRPDGPPCPAPWRGSRVPHRLPRPSPPRPTHLRAPCAFPSHGSRISPRH